MLFYDEGENEVKVYGCSTCPFRSTWTNVCKLSDEVYIYENKYFHVRRDFPYNCPLRDPNFKLTRIFE